MALELVAVNKTTRAGEPDADGAAELRLRVLAGVLAGRTARERAARLTSGAAGALGAGACVLLKAGDAGGLQPLVSGRVGVSEAYLERLAARAGADVSQLGAALFVDDLQSRYGALASTSSPAFKSYLGLPLRDPEGVTLGVVGVFGAAAGAFGEEERLWLAAAGQAVTDALVAEAQRARLSELGELLAKALPKEMEPEPGATETPKLSVLVVDDDHAVSDLIRVYLEEEGFRVESVHDGLEAIRRFRPAEHDVVLTDVAMPHMNGWEVVAALRVRAPELPVILITGYASGNWNREYLRQKGIAAAFSKPLNLDGLVECLKQMAEGKRTQKAV